MSSFHSAELAKKGNFVWIFSLNPQTSFGLVSSDDGRFLPKINVNVLFLVKTKIAVHVYIIRKLKVAYIANKPLTRAPRFILIKSFFLAIGWSYLYDLSHTHVFKKTETTMRWNWMWKALRFLQITVEYQDCPFFYLFLTIKTLFRNISITLMQILL